MIGIKGFEGSNSHFKAGRSLYRCILLLFRTSRKELLITLVLNFVFGSGPAALLYLTKVIINHTTVLLFRTHTESWNLFLGDHILLVSTALFVLVNLLLDSAQTINQFVSTSLRDRLQGEVKGMIFRKVSEYEDISLFENPKLLNTLHLAQENLSKTTQIALVTSNMITGVFVLIPVLLISFSIVWWVPLLIFASAIPSVWIQLHYEEQTYSVQHAQADTVRQMKIYEEVLIGERYAKELRQFQLQPMFYKRWRKLFVHALDELLAIRKKGSYAVFLWSLLSGIGAGLPFVYVLVMTIHGRYSIGDLAMYAGLIFEIRRSLFVIIGNLGNLQSVGLASDALFDLLGLPVVNLRQETAETQYRSESRGLQLSDVSFAYPGTDRLTLKRICLSVAPGEFVVIVGANGAGKTTLAKLLCRLYDPTVGQIFIGGKDYRSLDLNELRSMVAVVNQDHVKWPSTLRENIGYGKLDFMENKEVISRSLSRMNLVDMVKDLPRGIDTPLSKQLEGGIDLSGGQWQRVAIARAILRHESAEILILDEPTASIDPDTEQDVFRVFREMSQGKITFVISHRMSLARIADKIVVLNNGEVVECGTHDELMQKQGEYERMFSLQASSYYTSG